MTSSDNISKVDAANAVDPTKIDFNYFPPATIILSPSQYASYEQSGIDICAPDGSVVHRFSKGSLFDQEHNGNVYLRNQLHLTEHLLLYLKAIELPESAVRGLETLVIQSRMFVDKHIR